MRIARNVRAAALAGLVLSSWTLAVRAQERTAAAATGVGVKVETRAYDVARLAAPHGLAANIYRGRAIFLQRCAYCHDGVGQPSYNTLGPWLDPEVTAALGDAGIRTFLVQGTEKMPSFQYALSPAQIDDVIAYVKTIPASAKPTEDQLAGRLPGTKASAGAPTTQGND